MGYGNIVIVNVSQQIAPTPNTLQKTGAFISQGATSTAPGTLTLLTEMSSLSSIINGSAAISSISASGSGSSWTVTVATTTPHGLPISDILLITITGASPSAYNGTYRCTITGTSTFTYTLTANPGLATTTGVYTLEDVGELNAMATTFFAQGNNQSVYVLELGAGNPAEGVAYLTTWLINNVNTIYSFLVPRTWGSEPTFQTLIQSYEAPNKKTYFWVTMTLSNYTSYSALQKCVFGLIEAPSVIPTAEFSLAAPFYHSLNYDPSATNKVAPFAFSFVYGVTPYPTFGNSALLATLKAASVNIIGTGAEGGISNTIIFWGTTMDGNDFTYWYSVDWVQINCELMIANAIINGSNNPVNPLYYNQQGINVLEGVIASVIANGVTFGLVLGTPIQVALDGPDLDYQINLGTYQGRSVVNAIPFITYSNENPGDYKIGKYSGFSVIYVPARGFTQIVLNLVVSQFVSA